MISTRIIHSKWRRKELLVKSKEPQKFRQNKILMLVHGVKNNFMVFKSWESSTSDTVTLDNWIRFINQCSFTWPEQVQVEIRFGGLHWAACASAPSVEPSRMYHSLQAIWKSLLKLTINLDETQESYSLVYMHNKWICRYKSCVRIVGSAAAVEKRICCCTVLLMNLLDKMRSIRSQIKNVVHLSPFTGCWRSQNGSDLSWDRGELPSAQRELQVARNRFYLSTWWEKT